MANIKVSEMTEATVFDDGDYAMIVQANQNKKISKENIFTDVDNNIATINNSISTINTNIGNLTSLKTQDTTDIVSGINSIIDAEIYSTNEVKTNKVWIDGNPIYKRTFTGTYISSSSRVVVELLSDASKIVNSYGMYSPNTTTPNTGFGQPQIGTAGGIDAYSQIQLTSAGVIRACFITPQSAYSGDTGSYEITVEYTKTTD